MDWDYRVPGVRFFVTHANGTTDITVDGRSARQPDRAAWATSISPSCSATARSTACSSSAGRRSRSASMPGRRDMSRRTCCALAYLMPTNIILAGSRRCRHDLKASKAGRNDVLTIAVPRLGGGEPGRHARRRGPTDARRDHRERQEVHGRLRQLPQRSRRLRSVRCRTRSRSRSTASRSRTGRWSCTTPTRTWSSPCRRKS